MEKGIIISENGLFRKPRTAFLLSFFFTGLGQVYNGDMARGAVFFLLRIISIIIPAIVAVTRNNESYIYVFAGAICCNIIIWILSSLEARYTAVRTGAYNLKIYNTAAVYFMLALMNFIIMIISLIFLSFFLSVEMVRTDDMKPAFSHGELILVNKYSYYNSDIGDAVVYSENGSDKIGRIIASGGETFAYADSRVYVNDSVLNLGILNAGDMDHLGLDNAGELFYETNGNRRYPVRVVVENNFEAGVKPRKTAGRIIVSGRVKKGMLLLSSDNRGSGAPFKTVPLPDITGRVEGIIFSFKLSRLLLQPYIDD